MTVSTQPAVGGRQQAATFEDHASTSLTSTMPKNTESRLTGGTGNTSIRPRILSGAVRRIRRQSRSKIETDTPLPQDQFSTGANEQPLSSASVSEIVDLSHFFKTRVVEGRSVNTLQEWQGTVEMVEDGVIHAQLRDMTTVATDVEFAEIPIEEIEPKDRSLVRLGAIFHVTIGYSRRGGTHMRESIIYFRKHSPKQSSVPALVADLLEEFGDIEE